MEYAVMFTDIQKALRKYHNPNLTITFDCASPFYGAAKGLAYFNTNIEHNKKWSYSMKKTAEDKKYANDKRKFSDAVVADKIHDVFADSPVTERMLINDLCYRGVGFLNNQGKETKTSWDTLSYTMLQAHNVYQHIWSVQEANRRYEQGVIPKMLMNENFGIYFSKIVDEIFSQKTREKSLEAIEYYNKFYLQMQSGSQGISGKRTVNAMTMFDELFTVEEPVESEVEETNIDSDDAINEVLED
jgi:hypothetical protein